LNIVYLATNHRFVQRKRGYLLPYPHFRDPNS